MYQALLGQTLAETQRGTGRGGVDSKDNKARRTGQDGQGGSIMKLFPQKVLEQEAAALLGRGPPDLQFLTC